MAKKLTSQFRIHTILKQFKIWLQKLTCSSYQNNQITKIGGIISVHLYLVDVVVRNLISILVTDYIQ